MPTYSDQYRFGEEHTQEEWTSLAEFVVPQFMTEHPEITAADSLYSYMREEGYYVPRNFVRDAWREEKQVEGYRGLYNRLSEESLIPRQWHQESDYEWERNTAYVVRIRGVDVSGEEELDRYVTLTADRQLSIEEIETEAGSHAALYGYEVIQGFPSISIERAIHKRGSQWSVIE